MNDKSWQLEATTLLRERNDARAEVARLRHLTERAISPFMCSENCDHNADYTQKEALHDLETYLRQTLPGDES